MSDRKSCVVPNGQKGLVSTGELFTRHSASPILTADAWPYPAHAVFNAAAAQVNGETLLLVRVEDYRGLSHLTVARSKNGVDQWRIDAEPTFPPSPDKFPEEIWGIEDPRVTWHEELKCWSVVYAAYSHYGPLVSLATTEDFVTFKRLGAVLPPEDKDAALFPHRMNGRWAMLHRPVPANSRIGAHIWMSYSPDLIHWGGHKIVLSAREGGWWDAHKIGLSAPPLETPKGWLVLYHRVRNTAAGCIYRLGLALLSLQDPSQVLQRSEEWIFGPRECYETTGDVGNVVFPCGWILQGDDIRLYYGGADSCVCLATGKLSDLLDWLEHQPQGRSYRHMMDRLASRRT